MMKKVLSLILSVVLLAAFTVAGGCKKAEEKKVGEKKVEEKAEETKPPSPFEIEKLTGEKAPDFTLKDLNGQPVSLASFKGKVVVINFWATWCPPCKDEMPSIDKLNQLMKDRGLVVLALSMDNAASKVKDFVKKNPFSFTILLDEKMEVSRSYKVFSLPTTFIIDKSGVLVEKHMGEKDWADPKMVKAIEALL